MKRILGIVVLMLLIAGCTIPESNGIIGTKLPTFKSCSEIYEKMKEAKQPYSLEELSAATNLKTSMEGGVRYSTTNVQVEGIDEADIVKTDGKYLYVLSLLENKIFIVDAYPITDGMEIKSTIEEKPTHRVYEIIIENGYLALIGNYHETLAYPNEQQVSSENIKLSNENIREKEKLRVTPSYVPPSYPEYVEDGTFIQIYDVSDVNNPKKIREIKFEGRYVSSRLKNSTLYVVIGTYLHPLELNKPLTIAGNNSNKKIKVKVNESIVKKVVEGSADIIQTFKQVIAEETAKITAKDEDVMPRYEDSLEGSGIISKCNEVVLPPEIEVKQFITVAAISLKDPTAKVMKKTIAGGGEKIYMSHNNLYVSGRSRSNVEYGEYTVVYKFSLDDLNYKGYAKVKGYLLNQFSMDEHNGYFRIATTNTERAIADEPSKSQVKTSPPLYKYIWLNNIYVFDENMKLVGKLEGLAPEERIYSARFVGDRVYLVTFKKVDPLFVIDLSNPEKPKVLGKLKIPGYSNYLHPIDKNHILGIGKETVEAEEGNFAWYQGLKLAVFDVSDVEHPKQLYNYTIGDRGTDSPVLYDHKAFLYDKERGLLAIPVRLAKIDKEEYCGSKREKCIIPPTAYGKIVMLGAYVFNLDIEKGLELKGVIVHENVSGTEKIDYYSEVQRILYIEDVIYTISNKVIKASSIDSLEELDKLYIYEP